MRVVLPLAFAFLFSAPAMAQQELVGTYKGEYWEPGYAAVSHRPRIQVVTLQILHAQDGKVTGKYELANDDCRGTYDFKGTFQDGKLTLRTEEGAKSGCAQQITLSTNGSKLVGNVSAEAPGRPGIELSKQ